MAYQPPERIFLIGMPGSGKSTVGRALASRLNWQFADSDECIQQRTGVSVSTIFELEGEAGFRRRESEVLCQLAARNLCIIATGGGAVLSPENCHCMKSSGAIVYLEARRDTLLRRLRRDRSRPLLQGRNFLEKIDTMLAARIPIYRSLCDYPIDIGNRPASQVAEEIVGLLWSRDEAVMRASKAGGKTDK